MTPILAFLVGIVFTAAAAVVVAALELVHIYRDTDWAES